MLMPIFYLSGESPPFIFVIHFVKKKLITKSVPVLKLPEKKCIIPSSRNISVKLLRNQVSAENIGIKVSALITPSETLLAATVLPLYGKFNKSVAILHKV